MLCPVVILCNSDKIRNYLVLCKSFMSNAALEVSMHAYNVTDSFVNYGMWKIGSKSDSHTRKICGGLEGKGVHSLFLLTLSAVLNYWLLQYLLTYVLLLLEAMGHVLYFFVYLACSALCQTNNLRKFLKQKELRMDELKILVLFLRHLCLLWVQPIFFSPSISPKFIFCWVH